MPDLLSRPETEPEEDPARFRRRLIRWLAILTIGTIVMVACWQDPLYP
ncbi:hypothetical protein GCM10010168_54030 [Actinoplanes ianthinogenes]|uniref:Uncharacterized protein n=1 Tax=Actinoplanes ianthinogenes TaxID=122358 RepID=A0ABM7LQP8_9ACTN|nr:hypothetical protein [Actinoplanes ianthinogenes]BCJ41599.1 hypothetical protein Aiant_22560 [Actinoplanes ianthinogenes]GGR29024.1 hypothetical protein GCM10010168_54030 [Actinoplanes ianthinogenes]